MNSKPSSPSGDTLVDTKGLASAVFGEAAPSERTLRTLTRRGVLPYFKIGGLVRYSPAMVREALEKQCLVQFGDRKARQKTPRKADPSDRS